MLREHEGFLVRKPIALVMVSIHVHTLHGFSCSFDGCLWSPHLVVVVLFLVSCAFPERSGHTVPFMPTQPHSSPTHQCRKASSRSQKNQRKISRPHSCTYLLSIRRTTHLSLTQTQTNTYPNLNTTNTGHCRKSRQERHPIHRQEEVLGPQRPHRGPIHVCHPSSYFHQPRKGSVCLCKECSPTQWGVDLWCVWRPQGCGWLLVHDLFWGEHLRLIRLVLIFCFFCIISYTSTHVRKLPSLPACLPACLVHHPRLLFHSVCIVYYLSLCFVSCVCVPTSQKLKHQILILLSLYYHHHYDVICTYFLRQCFTQRQGNTCNARDDRHTHTHRGCCSPSLAQAQKIDETRSATTHWRRFFL